MERYSAAIPDRLSREGVLAQGESCLTRYQWYLLSYAVNFSSADADVFRPHSYDLVVREESSQYLQGRPVRSFAESRSNDPTRSDIEVRVAGSDSVPSDLSQLRHREVDYLN